MNVKITTTSSVQGETIKDVASVAAALAVFCEYYCEDIEEFYGDSNEHFIEKNGIETEIV